MNLIKNWPYYEVSFRGHRLKVTPIADDNANDIDPSGEYYIIERDQTNTYGYHTGGAPEITTERVGSVDAHKGRPPQQGHSRILAKLLVHGTEATIVKHAETLVDREGL